MDEQQLKDLETAANHMLQKVRLLRAVQASLSVYRKNGHSFTPSAIRKAELEVRHHERVLLGVTETLIDEAKKVTKALEQRANGDRPLTAARGD